jgi:Interferon-related developmental regulator (IFRD)
VENFYTISSCFSTINLFLLLLLPFFIRHISHLSTLLESDDRAVRMAAGESIALFFELKLLDVQLAEESHVERDPKYQLFIYMQGMKAKVTAQIDTLSSEAGGKGADKKNLNDQRELFQKIWDYVKVFSISSLLIFFLSYFQIIFFYFHMNFYGRITGARKRLLRFQVNWVC